jgi:tetratricopeptide (TPR) repeat protein
MLKEAERLESVPDEIAAFHKFRDVVRIQPLNIYALNKCSELCSRIGKRQTNVQVREDYYSAAKSYAGIALKINPNNSQANCAMAMVLGRGSMARSGKEKIENAKEVKKYVDIAIKNDPLNYLAWHILGRWHYEINNLNLIERAAVKVLYGGLPSASIKESINAFEKVRSIEPRFILNYFEMAKAYKQHHNEDKAKAYLRFMLALPNRTEDDPSIKELGKKLLKEWK